MQRTAQTTSLGDFDSNAAAIAAGRTKLGVVEWAEEGRGREDGRRVPGTYRQAAGQSAEEGLRKFS